MTKLVGLVMLAALHVAVPPSNAKEGSAPAVVFVCERGSAKSVIAALWFMVDNLLRAQSPEKSR